VLVLLLPLLALLATGHLVNRAREDGTLELLLTHPIGRDSYLVAVTLVRSVVLVLPLAALMGALGLTGQLVFGQPVPWGFVGRTLLVSSALSCAFVGIGIAVSVSVRSVSRATTLLLGIWATAIALVDFALIGLLLQWQAPPRVVFLLAALNPVEAARMALLSAAEPDLATLGPVGFYLANQVGIQTLFALGVAWPAALGALAWAFALRAFLRGDVL
jgi:ABC-type transport system involved in multi-copper enzyme maturation permease subunit